MYSNKTCIFQGACPSLPSTVGLRLQFLVLKIVVRNGVLFLKLPMFSLSEHSVLPAKCMQN